MNDLEQIPEDRLFGELRRRNLGQSTLFDQLHLTPPPKLRPALRRVALRWLSIFTACLIAAILLLIGSGKEAPDFLQTLVGTCIGAIAGILTGSQES